MSASYLNGFQTAMAYYPKDPLLIPYGNKRFTYLILHLRAQYNLTPSYVYTFQKP